MKSEIPTKINDVLKTTSHNIASNYQQILPFLTDKRELNEVNSIVYEISMALLFGLPQAAITLTNHLLEKILKLGLIYNETGIDPVKGLDDANSKFKEAIDAVDNLDLEGTINRSCTRKLITKETKKILLIYKNRLRNPFSHAGMRSTFGEVKIKAGIFSFTDPNKKEIGEMKIADVPFMQGLAQDNLAAENALSYFSKVYDVLKNIESVLYKIHTTEKNRR